MKNKRRIVSVLLTLVLVAVMAMPVAAAGSGTITIDNAVAGHTYSAYKLLDLESYDAAKDAYSYKTTSKWEAFVKSSDVKGVYLDVDANGYVTWVENADAAAFAKKAQAYAVEKNIAAEESAEANSATVAFTELDLGYYLVDTTLGTLCSLDTTNPTVNIKEKNEAPDITKQVREGSAWGSWNDAEIGQAVEFQAVITAYPGGEKYVMHDAMNYGLDLNVNSIKVKEVTKDEAGNVLGEMNLDKGRHFDVATNVAGCTKCGTNETCDFEVRFAQDYLDTIKTTDTIAKTELVVYYTATVNASAVIGTPGNPNTAVLSYGSKVTPHSTTTTYTWYMDVLKYGNGDKTNVLKGAEFVLLNAQDQEAVFENGKLTGWTAADQGTKMVSGNDGRIHIDGLDQGTYYLKETAAPEGYNKLNAALEVKIERTGSGTTVTYNTGVVEVNNNSGTELPSTGGMGTTLFYLMGAIMVIGAGVVLVTRRRVA